MSLDWFRALTWASFSPLVSPGGFGTALRLDGALAAAVGLEDVGRGERAWRNPNSRMHGFQSPGLGLVHSWLVLCHPALSEWTGDWS